MGTAGEASIHQLVLMNCVSIQAGADCNVVPGGCRIVH